MSHAVFCVSESFLTFSPTSGMQKYLFLPFTLIKEVKLIFFQRQKINRKFIFYVFKTKCVGIFNGNSFVIHAACETRGHNIILYYNLMCDIV